MTKSGSAVGSFDPHFPVRPTTDLLADDIEVGKSGYQGNWIPHKLRPATADGIFFAGDSAGHCFPLTAEGIRPALYFGAALGMELREVVEGRASREQALTAYHDFSAGHQWAFDWLLRSQKLLPKIHPRLVKPTLAASFKAGARRLRLQPLPRHRPARIRRPRHPRHAGKTPVPA